MPRLLDRHALRCAIGLIAIAGLLSAKAHADGPLREFLKQRRNPAATAGSTSEHSIDVGGTARRYLVHLPASYNPARPTPLILAFHGGGGDMQHIAKDEHYGIVGKSDRAGFIVAFPNGTGALGDKLATWNAGACCGKARDARVDDVAFARTVVADLQRRYAVDAGRIFAIGMSNGGMLSHRLACEASDLFAGIAAVAGTDNTLSCAPARPISILHIHARNDDHVLFEGGAGPGAFRDESKVTQFVSVPQTISNWVARNQCSGTPRAVLVRAGARCEVHEGCKGGAKVELCVTEDGKHSWPGGGATRSGQQPSQAIIANDVIWDFFLSIPPLP
ncbi:prolyl oligopeptidase family serine peptidase [Niveibacterium sp. 24ML]|uniref:extracellular catalytic domain type 1 short-chain-length polyhydroxyalkanoate depolymerase n=1 Tax=Niveibacterium sp. 24ML TaxID=2985512 RepID=UPI00226FE6AD|nr:prolyl oligopeptidase family serine peptidase [Niveibacterium sp. 24ML]MCX9155682.1 prolyl oligopeptidase family serine peptidase [Niveibacterium sp. 24ML]